MICPETSARREVPVADMRWFTFSITSTKASFRRYLMSVLRYDIAPVACIVILDESSLCKNTNQYNVVQAGKRIGGSTTARSDFIDSVVMYIFKASISEF
jgi:hypothetical protein